MRATVILIVIVFLTLCSLALAQGSGAASPESKAESTAATEPQSEDQSAPGSEVQLETVPPEKPKKEPPPYRGSTVSLMNNVTAYSFDENADLTYNPYYSIGLALAPQWWFADYFGISLGFSLEMELTNSDYSKRRNEIYPSDVDIGFNFPVSLGDNWKLTPSLGVTLPTSKASNFITLETALSPALGISKTWPDALKGITLMARVGYTQYFFESKNPEYDGLRDDSCRTTWSPSCATLLYGSATNPIFAIPTSVGINLGIVDTLSFGFTFGYTYIYKYGASKQKAEMPGGSGNAVNPVQLESDFSNHPELSSGDRGVHMNTYVFDLSYAPIKWLGFSLGTATAGNQLGEDSTYRAPFFNRYTLIYLNFNLLLDGFAS